MSENMPLEDEYDSDNGEIDDEEPFTAEELHELADARNATIQLATTCNHTYREEYRKYCEWAMANKDLLELDCQEPRWLTPRSVDAYFWHEIVHSSRSKRFNRPYLWF